MRLVDADLLKADYFVPSSSTNSSNYLYVSMKTINDAPTVDAVEVKHGKWINKYPLSTCSVCKATMILNDYSNYCPNCGARMDGEEKSDG